MKVFICIREASQFVAIAAGPIHGGLGSTQKSGWDMWRGTPKSAFRRYKAVQALLLAEDGGEDEGLLEILP